MDKEQIYDTLNEAYFSDSPHEQVVVEALPLLLGGVTKAVDCGASLGQYTRALSRSLSGAEIISVEADPTRFEELERNAAAWSAESGNSMVARHFALTDVSGVAKYFVTNSNVSGGLTRHEDVDASWEEISVPATTLDDLVGDVPPGFVKIDVEGAELQVLQGAAKTLGARKTVFLVELHDWEGASPVSEGVFRLMRSHGYRWVNFYGQSVFVADPALWRRLLRLELRDGTRVKTRIKWLVKRVRSRS